MAYGVCHIDFSHECSKELGQEFQESSSSESKYSMVSSTYVCKTVRPYRARLLLTIYSRIT